ncbi:MAG TPA: hypothetical protein VK698_39185 [Kofleriaceae bacterium]|nr:hypothetical protein [Kofleriaceae bacterium]
MAQYRKKPIDIDAHQWHQNGDHPEDGPADREGSVVRYYRHPYVPGTAVCPGCQKTVHEHGWIDSGDDGRTVCPNDWVITTAQGEHYPLKPDVFAAIFEAVTG